MRVTEVGDALLVAGDERVRGVQPQVELCVFRFLCKRMGGQEVEILFPQAENCGSGQAGCRGITPIERRAALLALKLDVFIPWL